jgi:hypothetical protein
VTETAAIGFVIDGMVLMMRGLAKGAERSTVTYFSS